MSALLEDGRVFWYKYYYGSCSGCDSWESSNLPDEQIIDVMEKEATFFESKEQWEKRIDICQFE